MFNLITLALVIAAGAFGYIWYTKGKDAALAAAALVGGTMYAYVEGAFEYVKGLF